MKTKGLAKSGFHFRKQLTKVALERRLTALYIFQMPSLLYRVIIITNCSVNCLALERRD